MSGTDSAKTLLAEYNQRHYRAFTLNSFEVLTLPEISVVPWVGASKRRDFFEKKISHPKSDHHVKFITKNREPEAFLWQTNAEQLKKAVRWGIVRTHSITAKVISALGEYRVVAHERVAKGMVSNSQAVKLKLLELFQDRFEALQEIESLVNKQNTITDYKEAIGRYIQNLDAIYKKLDSYFCEVTPAGLDKNTIVQIKGDIRADINRADAYLTSVKDNDKSLLTHSNARGQDSIVEFVKQQMIHGLYELQGINQDISYSKQRYFALTRGDMNDVIENARKEIDDHQADARNAVRATHHGLYSANNDALLTYDFSADELTPAREREVLLAISFIEGWDKLQNTENAPPAVSNESGTEILDTIAATRWKNHRTVKALFKSVGYFILNIFKGVFVSTHPWEEESWNNGTFHLVAAELRAHARPNEPMWWKPVRFFMKIAYAMMDVFQGVRDFGTGLVFRMPADVFNDWESSQSLPPLVDTLTAASDEINRNKIIEQNHLKEILRRCGYSSLEETLPTKSKLASVEYALSAGEQNDVLTSIARGLNEFGSFFSHNIYAKDPMGGLLFTAAYAVGVGAIFMPNFTSSILGARYVELFSDFSYTMGSSQIAAAIAGGTTQAEIFAAGWDGLMHGPSGITMNTVYQFGEDPLSFGAYFAAAFGLGYMLANGIAGYQIPWLSEYLKADLGSVPETAYPFIGAKLAVLFYEALKTDPPENQPQVEFSVTPGTQMDISHAVKAMQYTIDRFVIAHWLSTNADILPKLQPRQLVAISRQVETYFSKEESESLRQLLYPETHSSIAFQLFAIPLAYVPAILRFGVSFLVSLVAFGSTAPYPWEPIRRAAAQLLDQAKKDTSRLLAFSNYMIYLPYTLISSLLKITAYIATMTIGRVAGLFEAKPAHSMHKGLALLHAFFRHIGEFLYPASLLKSVAVAHPTHTIIEVEESYVKLIQRIGQAREHTAVTLIPLQNQTETNIPNEETVPRELITETVTTSVRSHHPIATFA